MSILVITVVLTFCGFTVAHPGHGTPYEEVTSNQTSNQNTGQSTAVTTNKDSKKGKISTKDKSSRDSTESAETTNKNKNNGDNQPVEVVSNISEVNRDSNNLNKQLMSLAIGAFIALGLGGIGYFFKGFL
ncbi:MAG: hypothetical protein HZC47_00250 [Methanobacterium sp.]|uniref:hypothetical protein n=1 Tax=Methanobacterium sp. TaxID=2164 RepID=UPI003D65A0AB|nr:hypothetical protein [Methanobacterium sp.]